MAVALLLAAGRGERLGSHLPKAFVELAGRPLLHWSLQALHRSPEVAQIVLALPAGSNSPPEGVELPEEILCVPGGPVRSASVRLALAAASPQHDVVVVHDAARPLLRPELVRRTLAALDAGGCEAAIAASPVGDTVKRAVGDPPIVAETLDRSGLWAVQTPQVFRRESLERALDVSAEVLAAATDDAWLVERAGGRVAIVPSGPQNLKVTTSVDLQVAEISIRSRSGDLT